MLLSRAKLSVSPKWSRRRARKRIENIVTKGRQEMADNDITGMTRRDFIKLGAAAGGLAPAGPELIRTALANRPPPPRPTSLKYLDRNMYRKNHKWVPDFDPGRSSQAQKKCTASASRGLMSR